jgi:hypothetical protein
MKVIHVIQRCGAVEPKNLYFASPEIEFKDESIAENRRVDSRPSDPRYAGRIPVTFRKIPAE